MAYAEKGPISGRRSRARTAIHGCGEVGHTNTEIVSRALYRATVLREDPLPPESESPPLPLPARKLDLRKTLFLLPNIITLSSVFCGFDSIRISASAQGDDDFYRASLLLVFALFFDMLDGRVARLTKTQSAFGLQIDSLADVISFGVAPAAIAYGCGMHGLYDRIVLVFFVACGVSRLARFNITAEALSGGGDKVKYFEGTPIPTSLFLVLLLWVAASQGAIGAQMWGGVVEYLGFNLHPLVLLFALSGSLMVSRIRIPKL